MRRWKYCLSVYLNFCEARNKRLYKPKTSIRGAPDTVFGTLGGRGAALSGSAFSTGLRACLGGGFGVLRRGLYRMGAFKTREAYMSDFKLFPPFFSSILGNFGDPSFSPLIRLLYDNTPHFAEHDLE